MGNKSSRIAKEKKQGLSPTSPLDSFKVSKSALSLVKNQKSTNSLVDKDFMSKEFDPVFLESFNKVFDMLAIEHKEKKTKIKHITYDSLVEYLGISGELCHHVFEALTTSNTLLTKCILLDSLAVMCADVPSASEFRKSFQMLNTRVSTDRLRLPEMRSALVKESKIMDLFVPHLDEITATMSQASLAFEDDQQFLSLFDGKMFSHIEIESALLTSLMASMADMFCTRLAETNTQQQVRTTDAKERAAVIEGIMEQIYRHVFGEDWDGNMGKPLKLKEFQSWTRQNARGSIFSALSDYLFEKFFLAKLKQPVQSVLEKMHFRCRPFHDLPQITGKSAILNDMDVWTLSLFIPWKGDRHHPHRSLTWSTLYSASRDGFSMNRFENHCFKYDAPTLMLIKARPLASTADADAFVIGLLIHSTWKKAKKYFGCEKTTFFELKPYPEAFPAENLVGRLDNDDAAGSPGTPSAYASNFGSLNQLKSSNNDVSTDVAQSKLVYCSGEDGGIIGIDGYTMRNTKGFRLNTDLRSGEYEYDPVAEELGENCFHFMNPKASYYARKQDKGNSSAGFHIKFVTDEIEVYGLGDQETYDEHVKFWKFDKKEAERRANVNMKLDNDVGENSINQFVLSYAGAGLQAENLGIKSSQVELSQPQEKE